MEGVMLLAYLVLMAGGVVWAVLNAYAQLTPEEKRQQRRYEYFHKFGKFPEED